MDYKLKEKEIIDNLINRLTNSPYSLFKKQFMEEINIYSNGNGGLFFEQLLGLIRLSLKNMGHYSFPSMTYGSSLVSYLLGASDNNPLPLHYYCSKCNKIELINEKLTPWDIDDKKCECGGIMKADGFDIPYETHTSLMEHPFCNLFVGSDALEVTYDIIREHLKEYDYIEEVNEDSKSKVFTLILDESNQNGDKPLYESNPHITIAPKSSLDELKQLENEVGVSFYDINYRDIKVTGKEIDLGLLEESDLIDIKPKNKYQLLKICGMIHGINVWCENGEILISKGIVDLSDFPAFREDIFQFIAPKLERYGFDRKYASIITKMARTGRFAIMLIPKEIMDILDTIDLPSWFMDFLKKVLYMFSKSHGIELCRLGLATSFYKSKLK